MERAGPVKRICLLYANKGKTKNEGNFALSYHARVITQYDGWGPLVKPFWSLYSYLFYNRIRRKAIEECRNYMITLANMIKEHFNTDYHEEPVSSGF